MCFFQDPPHRKSALVVVEFYPPSLRCVWLSPQTTTWKALLWMKELKAGDKSISVSEPPSGCSVDRGCTAWVLERLCISEPRHLRHKRQTEIGKGLLAFLSIASRWERTNLGRNTPTKQERSWVFLQKPDMVFSPWMWCADFIVWGLSWQMWGKRGPGVWRSICWKCRGAEKQPQGRGLWESPTAWAESWLGLELWREFTLTQRWLKEVQCQPKKFPVSFYRVLPSVPRWPIIFFFLRTGYPMTFAIDQALKELQYRSRVQICDQLRWWAEFNRIICNRKEAHKKMVNVISHQNVYKIHNEILQSY